MKAPFPWFGGKLDKAAEKHVKAAGHAVSVRTMPVEKGSG